MLIPSARQPLVTALFLGTALSISSVKIVAMVLMEVGAIRRDLGQLILATAILDDTHRPGSSSPSFPASPPTATVELPHVGLELGQHRLFLLVEPHRSASAWSPASSCGPTTT